VKFLSLREHLRVSILESKYMFQHVQNFFVPVHTRVPSLNCMLKKNTNNSKVFLLEKYTDINTKDITRGYVVVEIFMYNQQLKEILVILDCMALQFW
jgi:hypothetical protein